LRVSKSIVSWGDKEIAGISTRRSAARPQEEAHTTMPYEINQPKTTGNRSARSGVVIGFRTSEMRTFLYTNTAICLRRSILRGALRSAQKITSVASRSRASVRIIKERSGRRSSRRKFKSTP
jgi:hypothetical protein